MGGGAEPAASRKTRLTVEETRDAIWQQMFSRPKFCRSGTGRLIFPWSSEPENGDVPREFPGL